MISALSLDPIDMISWLLTEGFDGELQMELSTEYTVNWQIKMGKTWTMLASVKWDVFMRSWRNTQTKICIMHRAEQAFKQILLVRILTRLLLEPPVGKAVI